MPSQGVEGDDFELLIAFVTPYYGGGGGGDRGGGFGRWKRC